MAIADKTRKLLWAKSGNRCAMCRTELFKNDSQNGYNIGEECHIISAKVNGPRHKPDIDDYDIYDNLILLCRNHHREIDELTNKYTEEVLRSYKKQHENWVESAISDGNNNKTDGKPEILVRVTSGKELLDIISGCHGLRSDYDKLESEDDAEYIGGVIQELIDYGDVSGMVEAGERVKMGFQLNQLIKELDDKGYFIFGERTSEKVVYANGEKDIWAIATIAIKRKDNAEIITFDLPDGNNIPEE